MDTTLNIRNLCKTYSSAGHTLTVLDNINLSVEAGSTVAVIRPSGSGKTTLLGLSAGLDRSTQGTIELNNITLDKLSEDERAKVRNLYVGFIFSKLSTLTHTDCTRKCDGAAGTSRRKKYKEPFNGVT